MHYLGGYEGAEMYINVDRKLDHYDKLAYISTGSIFFQTCEGMLSEFVWNADLMNNNMQVITMHMPNLHIHVYNNRFSGMSQMYRT